MEYENIFYFSDDHVTAVLQLKSSAHKHLHFEWLQFFHNWNLQRTILQVLIPELDSIHIQTLKKLHYLISEKKNAKKKW